MRRLATLVYRALEPTLLHELDLAFFEDRYAVAGPAGQRVLDEMARNDDARKASSENGTVSESVMF